MDCMIMWSGFWFLFHFLFILRLILLSPHSIIHSDTWLVCSSTEQFCYEWSCDLFCFGSLWSAVGHALHFILFPPEAILLSHHSTSCYKNDYYGQWIYFLKRSFLSFIAFRFLFLLMNFSSFPDFFSCVYFSASSSFFRAAVIGMPNSNAPVAPYPPYRAKHEGIGHSAPPRVRGIWQICALSKSLIIGGRYHFGPCAYLSNPHLAPYAAR